MVKGDGGLIGITEKGNSIETLDGSEPRNS
jgi:hypothetical protein